MDIREIGLIELIAMPLELHKKFYFILSFHEIKHEHEGMYKISMLIIPFNSQNVAYFTTTTNQCVNLKKWLNVKTKSTANLLLMSYICTFYLKWYS